MKEVKFLKQCLYGDKDEVREVTDRAAEAYAKLGLVETSIEKEEKQSIETKEEKEVFETKEKKTKAKITKAPKF